MLTRLHHTTQVQRAIDIIDQLPKNIAIHTKLPRVLQALLERHQAHAQALAQRYEAEKTREYMYELSGPEMWPHDREERREWFKELVPEYKPPTTIPPHRKWRPMQPQYVRKMKRGSYSPVKEDIRYKM